MTKDRILGILSVVLGVAVAIGASQLPASMMANDVGPAVFPYISAGLLIICGAALTIKKPGVQGEPFFNKEQLLRLAKIAAVMVIYIILESLFGFLIPSILALFVLCMMFSQPGQTKWWQALIFAAIVTVVIYLLFTNVFSMVLPRGSLL